MNISELQYQDIIDVNELIDYVQETEEPDAEVLELLELLEGQGGDVEFNGAWYPATLIRETYFTESIMDFLRDCDALPSDLQWYIVIDEDATAKNLKSDYSEVDVNGTTYYYR